MTDRLMALPEVLQRTALSKGTLYSLMRRGQFPRPIKVGDRVVRWYESEVDAHIASLPRAGGQQAA